MNAKEFTEFEELEFTESVWCNFTTSNKEKVLIGSIYCSPHTSVQNTDKLLKLLKSDKFNLFTKVIIIGDFNYPTINWKCEWATDEDNKFVGTIRDNYFTQHIKKPTRFRDGQKSNILDLV